MVVRLNMTTKEELDTLKEQLKQTELQEKLDNEAVAIKAKLREKQVNTELNINHHGIRGAMSDLKAWLVAEKSWLSFKLIILGISFYYGGAFTHYENYGTYFELGGVIFVIIGLIRLPLAKQVWEWIDK